MKKILLSFLIFTISLFSLPIQAPEHLKAYHWGECSETMQVSASYNKDTKKVTITVQSFIVAAKVFARIWRNFGDNQDDPVFNSNLEDGEGDNKIRRYEIDFSGKSAGEYHIETSQFTQDPSCGTNIFTVTSGGGGGDDPIPGRCHLAFTNPSSTTGEAIVNVWYKGAQNELITIWLLDPDLPFPESRKVEVKTNVPEGESLWSKTVAVPSLPKKTYYFVLFSEDKQERCTPDAGRPFEVKTKNTGQPPSCQEDPEKCFRFGNPTKDLPIKIRFNTVGAAISSLLPALFGLAGMLSLLFIIWGGIRYLTSRGDPKAAESARNTITYAVIGLLIVTLSVAIFGALAAILKFDIFSFLPSGQVYAAACDGSKDIGCIVKLGNTPVGEVFPTFGALFTTLIRAGLFVAALLFFFMIVWSGFRYLSAGSDIDAAAAARDTLNHAAIGLLIVVVSFFIIQVISTIADNFSIFT